MGSDKIPEVNAAEFEQLTKRDVVTLVDFWAPWCGPCRVLGKLLNEAADELASGGVSIVKVNVDDESELTTSLNVSSIPRLIAYKNGVVIGNKLGVPTLRELKKIVGLE